MIILGYSTGLGTTKPQSPASSAVPTMTMAIQPMMTMRSKAGTIVPIPPPNYSLKDTISYCAISSVASDNDVFATIFDMLQSNQIANPPTGLITAYNNLLGWTTQLKTSLPDPTMPTVWTDLSNIIRGWPYYEANYMTLTTWGRNLKAAVTAFDDAVTTNANGLATILMAANYCVPEQNKRNAAAAAQTMAAAQQAALQAAAAQQAAADAAAAAAAAAAPGTGVLDPGIVSPDQVAAIVAAQQAAAAAAAVAPPGNNTNTWLTIGGLAAVGGILLTLLAGHFGHHSAK